MTNRSKHFMTMSVSAKEGQSLRQVIDDFFGTGIMVSVLNYIGTTDCDGKMLKMSVRKSVSWVNRPFRIQPEMPSGSTALQSPFFFSCCDRQHVVV